MEDTLRNVILYRDRHIITNNHPCVRWTKSGDFQWKWPDFGCLRIMGGRRWGAWTSGRSSSMEEDATAYIMLMKNNAILIYL